ncbi:SRPBCC family protein [Arthrobacter sp. MMS24-T111]
MAHAENRIVIDRPAGEVYDFLADGLNNTAWREGVKSISLREGGAGEVGAVYNQTLSGPKGRPIQGDYRITAAQPGHLLAFEVVAGPARPTGTYTLAGDSGRTTVTFILEAKLPLLLRVLDSMVTRTMESEVAQLSKLKQVLESR